MSMLRTFLNIDKPNALMRDHRGVAVIGNVVALEDSLFDDMRDQREQSQRSRDPDTD